MRFPWTKRETRSQTYSDSVVNLILSDARGDSADRTARPAVLEVCAGLWGRAFASATVTPNTPNTRALTPPILNHLGRELVRCGEAVFEIEVTGTGTVTPVTVTPVFDWEIEGDDVWLYKVTKQRPSGTVVKTLPKTQSFTPCTP